MAIGEPFVGIDYGRVGNNLPKSQAQVVKLLQDNGVKNVKIYDADHSVLGAFKNSGIKLSVAVRNEDVKGIADSQAAANEWVQNNIVPYSNIITSIGVGNEWLHPASAYKTSQALVPAMRKLQASLRNHSLNNSIKVSTPHAYGEFVNPGFPPSQGKFKDEARMREILDFLVENDSYFMLNVYPFFAYADSNGSIDEKYTLFKPTSNPVQDGRLTYTNMFDAMLDTFISAMAKLGSKYKDLPIVITETGWPNGGSTRRGVNAENARYYNQSVIKHVLAKKGTPLRPGTSFPTFIFALFDENLKTGGVANEEKHWGHFRVIGADGKNIIEIYPLRMAG